MHGSISCDHDSIAHVLQKGSSSGISATIEPQVLEDLGAAVSLLKLLARTHLPKEDQKHVLTAHDLRACRVRVEFQLTTDRIYSVRGHGA